MATAASPPPQTPIEVKPGYTTTEFWQSMLTQVVAGVVALVSVFSQRPNGQSEQWTSAINQLVPVVAALLASFATTRQYVMSRTQLKTTTTQANAAVEGSKKVLSSGLRPLFGGDGGPDLHGPHPAGRPDLEEAHRQEDVVRNNLNGNAGTMRQLIGDAAFSSIVGQVGGDTRDLTQAMGKMTVQQVQQMNELFNRMWDMIKTQIDHRDQVQRDAEARAVREDTDKNMREIDRLETVERTG